MSETTPEVTKTLGAWKINALQYYEALQQPDVTRYIEPGLCLVFRSASMGQSSQIFVDLKHPSKWLHSLNFQLLSFSQ